MAMMVGGTKPEEPANEDIQNICNEIRGELENKTGKKFTQYSAVKYTSQVVAGTNYFVKIKIEDTEYLHVRIFKPLPCNEGGLTLHSFQLGKSREDPVSHF